MEKFDPDKKYRTVRPQAPAAPYPLEQMVYRTDKDKTVVLFYEGGQVAHIETEDKPFTPVINLAEERLKRRNK